MKSMFDDISSVISSALTRKYSTSFSTAVRLLSPSIRQDIYNIYGYVRLADEVVDSFHNYDQQSLLEDLKADTFSAISSGISLNPILNSFQHTVNKHQMPLMLIEDFLQSMELDLHKTSYASKEEYDQYIYGSADVVGLMCLHIFVNGNRDQFEALKHSAMRLGSAFQKVNFLRDLKADYEQLGRVYFPGTDFDALDDKAKQAIISDIKDDMQQGYAGIKKLPIDARLGVYIAYRYYNTLLSKLSRTACEDLKQKRIRVPDLDKCVLFARCYVKHKFNLI